MRWYARTEQSIDLPLGVGGDRAVSSDSVGVEGDDGGFFAELAFRCWGEIVWSGEEDYVLALGCLCAGVQYPVELLVAGRSVFVADVFREDLGGDVLYVFSAVMDDGLSDAFRECVEEADAVALVAGAKPVAWRGRNACQVQQVEWSCG